VLPTPGARQQLFAPYTGYLYSDCYAFFWLCFFYIRNENTKAIPGTFLNYAGMGFGWLGAQIACKLAPAAAASFPLGLLAGGRKDTADDG